MKITVCLVAYSKRYDETKSFQALHSLKEGIKCKLNVRVFDNGLIDYSYIEMANEFASLNYIYNDLEERGTRVAYQNTMDFSQDEWILLLDDDTAVTENYFKIIFSELQSNTDITAYCPLIFEGKKQISPTASDTVDMLLFPKNDGIYNHNITGISSCLVIKIDFLKKIGGFNKKFPLDYLDHWLFYQLVDKEKKIKVLPVEIQHNLSVLKLEEVSKERFEKIFTSEYYFYKHYKPEVFYQIKKKYVKMIIKGFFNRNLGIRWTILLKILWKF